MPDSPGEAMGIIIKGGPACCSVTRGRGGVEPEGLKK